MKRAVVILCSFFLASYGCKKDPTSPPTPPPPPVVKGVYVLNEGNFGDPTGARLTLYDVNSDSTFRDVFEAANNGMHLGSLGDDMKLLDGKAYVLMSGSENIIVLSLSNHMILQSAFFPGAVPHDLLIDAARNRAYITRLFRASILVINLSTLSVIDSVSVGDNPQGMAMIGNQLYVCNSGYGSGRTVSVIDVGADSVNKTLTIGDGPANAAMAPDGKLWVSCTGNAFGMPATTGKVFIISPTLNNVTDSISFSENLWGSIAMGTDGHAYVIGVTSGSFYGGPIHRINAASKAVRLNFVGGTFYAVAVDKVTGDLYLADAKNFASDGEVRIYTKDGVLKKAFPAQRGPGVIAFKRE